MYGLLLFTIQQWEAIQFITEEQVLGAQKVQWKLWQTSRGCLLLVRPIRGCPCDSITLGQHSATKVTLSVQEVAVNMIQLQALGLHEKMLGNYCHSWLIVISTSKPVKRFSMFACNISWYMLGNEDKVWLKSNDQAMLRWICGVKTSDRLSMDSLYKCLGIAPHTILLRWRRLRCLGTLPIVTTALTNASI